ncbi:PadR family transcriptional regulator, partial [filamentous cyanobacterium CCP5]
RWSAPPPDPAPIREDLLVKVMAGASMPTALLVQELPLRRQQPLDQLTQYQAMEADYRSHADLPLPEQYRYLTLRRGIRYEQSWVDWCDEVLAYLSAH